MFHAIDITNDLFYVGAIDHKLRVFDVIMESPHGTSYNSFVLKGSAGVAVIEASKGGFEAEWIERIRDCVDPELITHIFLNHTEPDHAGALQALLMAAPNAKVYASRPALANITNILNAEFPGNVIKGGDRFDLGGVSLEVIDAPFLHWPDSLFLWCPEKEALFTCDVFGFHYASESIFYCECEEDLLKYRRYYFDAIFSPFSEYLQSAIAKICDLPIHYLLTSHGPIYNDYQEIQQAIAYYGDWAKETIDAYRPNDVFVGWASAYGYTKMATDALADVLIEEGLHPVLFDIGAQPEEAAKVAANCAAIVVGTSTLNRDALPPVWAFMAELSAIRLRGKPGLVLGSYGWSGEAIPNTQARLEQLGIKLLPSIRWKLKPTHEDLATVRNAARALALVVKGGK